MSNQQRRKRANSPTPDRDPQGAVRAAEIAIAAGEMDRARDALRAALAAIEEDR